jgi:hypothetical protein
VYGSVAAVPYALSLEAVRVDPAELEEQVRPPDVGLERRERVAERGRDERLRAEVEDGVDLLPDHGARQVGDVLEASGDDGAAADRAAPDQLRLRVRVEDQDHDVGSELEESGHEPRAEEAGRAGDEDAPPGPAAERALRAHAHTFHGARPEAHSSSSRRLSRRVSIGCQKPEWR